MSSRLAENRLYSWLSHRSYDLCTLVSPRWNSRRRWKKIFGRPLNEVDPAWWGEKLMLLKLDCYNRSPLVRQCANKYTVRAYVKNCGLERLLIPLLGLWRNENAVPWGTLPDQFVLKSTMGCGSHVFCRDFRALDIPAAKRTLHRALHDRYYLAYAEMQYAPGNDMRPEVIGEALLDTGDGTMLPDYKFFCFAGEPKYVLYCFDRGADGHAKYLFCDMDWTPRPELHPCSALDDAPPPPENLADMIDCARTLAAPFPFVRVDLYAFKGKTYFGELTFTPSACVDAEITEAGQLAMGRLLDLKSIDRKALKL